MKFIFSTLCICFILSCGTKGKNKNETDHFYFFYKTTLAEIDSLMFVDNYPVAINEINKILANNPNEGLLYYKKALCYASLEVFDSAEQNFLKSLGLGYKDGFSYHYVAAYYSSKEDYQMALIYLDSCLILNPNDDNAKDAIKRNLLKLKKKQGDKQNI